MRRFLMHGWRRPDARELAQRSAEGDPRGPAGPSAPAVVTALTRQEQEELDLQAVPLSWVAGVAGPPAYVNVGDALSPVLASFVSGRPIRRIPFRALVPRMTAIGTVGQSISGGRTEVWGTGCSPWANPLAGDDRRPYTPPPETTLRLHATRGPFSAHLLSGGTAPVIPYGDPAMLLPHFYAPKIRPRCELGVVLHLSELADRTFEAHPKPGLARYTLEAGDQSVRLITMVAPPGAEAVRAKIDELLACRRIVSTSLHGVAIAEAYGIPCLYLGAGGEHAGLRFTILSDAPPNGQIPGINARFPDLAAGLGRRRMAYWRQPKRLRTDWSALIDAIDEAWEPAPGDPDALAEACPAGLDPLGPGPDGTVWSHPLIAGIDLAQKAAA
ncbi:MAG: polysaccharide pyruvyl transferase family protein [Pseudomonadota bacterium]